MGNGVGLVSLIILGGLAGWVASKIMHTDHEQGVIMNIVVGVVGAVLGSLILQLLGGPGLTGFNLYSLLVAIAGSVLLLWLLRRYGNKI